MLQENQAKSDPKNTARNSTEMLHVIAIDLSADRHSEHVGVAKYFYQ